MLSGLWSRPATIERNRFVHKSLSCWSLNIAVGCEHACRFCYVPEVSTGKGVMADKLRGLGVADPDAQWGDYVFLRAWDSLAFHRSLRQAEFLTADELNADGNRAVMLCTTTDPYQVVASEQRPDDTDPQAGLKRTVELQKHRRELVQRSLAALLDESTLNVRILTRSPLAKQDFNLMKMFGPRLLFGMSIPTLRNDLAKIYEPRAPAPSQRLATLKAAKAAGLYIYAAVAPTYPECDEADLAATLRELVKLDPVTIFMEPINIRAENVARIANHAKSLHLEVGTQSSASPIEINTEVFATPRSWAAYARRQLHLFEGLAHDFNVSHKVLHLWPDKSLLTHFPEDAHWLQRCWSKISQWPGQSSSSSLAAPKLPSEGGASSSIP